MRTIGLILALGGVTAGAAFAQEHGAIVRGTVRDTTGRALSDVQVWIRPADLKARTDSVGRYQIDAVPAGPAIVTTGRIGYRSGAQTVVLAPGDSVTLNFSVVPYTLPDERPIMAEPVVPADSK